MMVCVLFVVMVCGWLCGVCVCLGFSGVFEGFVCG